MLNPLLFALGMIVAASRLVFAEGSGAGLAWDAAEKDYFAKRGETNAVMSFQYTNITSGQVTITAIKPSCHCTTVRDFELPKKVAPGEVGKFTVVVDSFVKSGVLDKTISVETTTGTNLLELKVHLPEPTAREQNQIAAFVNRGAVFAGDCAQCHAAPGVGKTGEPLFKAVCGICHDSAHRAEMVPDLANLKSPADAAYWRQWIVVGKPGTFMPGFHKKYGGPLTEEQIASLEDYLAGRFAERSRVAGKPRMPLN